MTGPIRPQAASGPTTPLGQRFNALVEALKAAHARTAGVPGTGDAVSAKLTALAHSPFADTLRSMAGDPSAYALDDNPNRSIGGVLGEYASGNPAADTVFLTYGGLRRPLGQPPADSHYGRMSQPEYILAHEMGHRMYGHQATAPGGPAEARAQDSTYAATLTKSASNEYWQKNPNEHYAEAMANAVSFLRATAQKSAGLDMPATTDAMAADYERKVPGTRAMVNTLLAQPIYANHPLNRSAAVPTPRPDMTATPMQGILTQALIAAAKKRQAGR